MILRSIASILIGLGLIGAGSGQPPPAGSPPTVQNHFGICDASTAIAVGQGKFLVANDECAHVEESNDCNKLLVYGTNQSGKALQEIDVTSFMILEKKKKEADLEGSASLGGWVYWIGSHARNKDGEIKANRHQLFALKTEEAGGKVILTSAGKSYTNLLKDLLADDRFKTFTRERLNPEPDKTLIAEKAGAINIEGLSAWQENRLLVGFRNPVPDGKAVLVPIDNPLDLATGEAKSAKLGEPIRLDLGGRGIRSIEFWEERKIYLIVGGPIGDPAPGEKRPFRLYQWSGARTEAPQEIADADLTGLNPEGILIYRGLKDRFQILSDDGQVKTNGVDCKELADDHPAKKFRTRWIHLKTAEKKIP